MPWDSETERKSLYNAALMAERYANALKQRGITTEREREVHDEHVAKFFVYDGCAFRCSLKTQEQFVAELKEMHSSKPPTASFVYDQAVFERHWRLWVQHLIDQHVPAPKPPHVK